MKHRNRDVQVFNLSMMDVISSAMGAFLIIMVVLARFYESDPSNSESVAELRRELQQAITEVDELASFADEESDDKLEKLIDLLRASLLSANNRLLDLQDRLNQATSQLERLRGVIVELELSIEQLQETRQQDEYVRQLKEQLDEAYAELERLRELIASYKQAQLEVESLRQRIAELEELLQHRPGQSSPRSAFAISTTSSHQTPVSLYLLRSTRSDADHDDYSNDFRPAAGPAVYFPDGMYTVFAGTQVISMWIVPAAHPTDSFRLFANAPANLRKRANADNGTHAPVELSLHIVSQPNRNSATLEEIQMHNHFSPQEIAAGAWTSRETYGPFKFDARNEQLLLGTVTVLDDGKLEFVESTESRQSRKPFQESREREMNAQRRQSLQAQIESLNREIETMSEIKERPPGRAMSIQNLRDSLQSELDALSIDSDQPE